MSSPQQITKTILGDLSYGIQLRVHSKVVSFS